MIKYCKDCKYYTEGWHYHWCAHPSLGLKLEDGKPNITQCKDMRWVGGKCGENAKLFDPKPSLIRKVIQIFKRAPTTKKGT